MLSKKPHSKLWLQFAGLVFATIFVVFIVVTLLWFMLFELNIIEVDPRNRHIPIVVFALGSLLLGTVIAVYVGKLIVRPVQNIGNAFAELSKGNFDIKVPENERIMEIREMAQRFNAMTYDLSHIETLRSDFVANVSHEFKTPIAAIEGYATLLQNHNLSPEKHDRYVEKILENSRRLTNLSGNILMLSKLENQEMVLGKTEYRLDEQIRKCILLSLESTPHNYNVVLPYFSIISPFVDMVTTCHGINLPLFSKARFAAFSIPPQQGTSIRTTVTLFMLLFAIISVSFSL